MSFFFLLFGIASGICFSAVWRMVSEKRIFLSWYHWLITFFWYTGIVFVLAFVGTSIEEMEPQAAGMALLIFGGLYLVVSFPLYRFLFAKQIKAKVVAE